MEDGVEDEVVGAEALDGEGARLDGTLPQAAISRAANRVPVAGFKAPPLRACIAIYNVAQRTPLRFSGTILQLKQGPTLTHRALPEWVRKGGRPQLSVLFFVWRAKTTLNLAEVTSHLV